jgi:hypothetical protein
MFGVWSGGGGEEFTTALGRGTKQINGSTEALQKKKKESELGSESSGVEKGEKAAQAERVATGMNIRVEVKRVGENKNQGCP